jgi:hypothetical protein
MNIAYSTQKAGARSTCWGVALWNACATRGAGAAIRSSANGARSAGAISSSTTPCPTPNQKNAEA